MKAECIKTCTIPKRGKVDKGENVDIDVRKWDEEKYPFLKHFKQRFPKPVRKSTDAKKVD